MRKNALNGSKERKEKLRVAAYIRVSTDMDVQDSSYQAQHDVYEKRIRENKDYEMIGIYGDQGKSGRHMKNRPELMRLLKDCELGKVDLILTKSISRFARNMKECVAVLRRLKELGVTVYFEREGIDSADSKCELMLNILASIAQEESNSISANLIWSHEKRAREGNPIAGKVPYGYRTKKNTWTVDEQESRRVKLAFQMIDEGYTYQETREALNAMERAERTGKIWVQVRLYRLLRNMCYTGDFITHKTIRAPSGANTRVKNRGECDQYLIEDLHVPLVSHEQYDRVQAVIESRLCVSNRKMTKEERIEKIHTIRGLNPGTEQSKAFESCE